MFISHDWKALRYVRITTMKEHWEPDLNTWIVNVDVNTDIC